MRSESERLSADTPVFFLYLAFIVILPLPFGGDQPWGMAIYEVLVFITTIGWLILYLQDKVCLTVPAIKARIMLGLFCLWLVYVGYQIWPVDAVRTSQVSVAPYLSHQAWLMSLVYALVFFLTLVLVDSTRRINQLCNVIIFSGVFQALYGSMMTLSGLEYSFFVKKQTYIGVATGTFYNRNHLAAYLVICLAIGIGLMMARLDLSTTANLRQMLRKWILLILSPKLRLRLYLVIMVIALVLTHSRMGNAAFFISLFVCGIAGLVLSRHATRGTIYLLTSLVIIDLLIVGAWFGIDKVAERLQETSAITESRDEVNRDAYRIWQDHKLVGTGLGTFPMVYPQYRSMEAGSGFYRQAHNDYMQFAVETGIIGLIILAAIVLPSLLVAVIAQHKRRDPLMRGLSFAAMMGITAMLIHASVEFNFQIPPNAAMFVVLLALAWVSRYHRGTRQNEIEQD